MPIPPEILHVERPKNTVVIAYGKDKDRYAVRQRTGCKYVEGRRIPVNGPVIGHIFDGKYVPLPPPSPPEEEMPQITIKAWGGAVLCDRYLQDIRAALTRSLGRSDGLRLYCLAILRTCCPDLPNRRALKEYGDSFLSEMYPKASLSQRSLDKMFSSDDLMGRIALFQEGQATAAAGHPLLSAQIVKTKDPTDEIPLLGAMWPIRPRDVREVPVLCAYDLEDRSLCTPEGEPDIRAYEKFLRQTGIQCGIIMAEGIFRSEDARNAFPADLDVHFLLPVDRADPAVGHRTCWSIRTFWTVPCRAL